MVRFVQGIAVQGHAYGAGLGAAGGIGSGRANPGGGGGGGGNRRGGAGGVGGFMMRPPPRKKLFVILAGVFAFALLLRRAQERADTFMDGWGVTSGRAGGGIDDRGTIAYDLSAATQDEIAELRALENSLGTAAITAGEPHRLSKSSSSQRPTTTATAGAAGRYPFVGGGETDTDDRNDDGDTEGGGGRGDGGGAGHPLWVSAGQLLGHPKVVGGSRGGAKEKASSAESPAAAVAGPGSGAAGPGGGGGGGGGAQGVHHGQTVRECDCDAALAEKITLIEKQAQRWQAMVLQRAQAHAAFASAEACRSGRHLVDDAAGPGGGVGGGDNGGGGRGVPAAAAVEGLGRVNVENHAAGDDGTPSREGAASSSFFSKRNAARRARGNVPTSTVLPGDGSVTWQREVLGVCVPYRARRDQLEVFASHMRTFLHGQGVPFRIYVGEQMAAGAFNRGWALNVAFTFAEPEVDYVVMHDVDMLPLPGVDYRFDPQREVRHLSTEVSQFDYSLPYDKYCSGVLMAHREFFRSVNGFSTGFWGWGGEDDEFCARVAKKKFPVGGWAAAERAPGGLSRMFGRPEKVGGGEGVVFFFSRWGGGWMAKGNNEVTRHSYIVPSNEPVPRAIIQKLPRLESAWTFHDDPTVATFSFVYSVDKLDDRGHIYFTPFYYFPGGRNFRHSDEGRGRFLSMEAGHGGTRRNPHWADNNKRLSAFLSSPDVVSPDGLATTGDRRVILKGKVETPLYTVYRSQFPPHLKQPKGE